MWDEEYGEIPDKSQNITKSAKIIDAKISEGKRKISADIGLCETCVFCSIYERELGERYFKCTTHEKILNSSKPKIIKCTEYRERGKPSLTEMINMAWTINDKKKTIKGFGQDLNE